MRAATLLALMGVSRPIYQLIISNEAISNHIDIMLLPASHVHCILFHGPNKIILSVCLSGKKAGLSRQKRDGWQV